MTASVREPEFEDAERPGFAYRRARVGRQAGCERLGASLFEIPPGNACFPYHWHHGNEELAVVLDGTPSLRTPEGWRELTGGEVACFPRGERGAHQIANFSEAPARVLIFSEMSAPDLVIQPDSGKAGAFDQAPGTPTRNMRWFRLVDEVDYWEGEEPPAGPE